MTAPRLSARSLGLLMALVALLLISPLSAGQGQCSTCGGNGCALGTCCYLVGECGPQSRTCEYKPSVGDCVWDSECENPAAPCDAPAPSLLN